MNSIDPSEGGQASRRGLVLQIMAHFFIFYLSTIHLAWHQIKSPRTKTYSRFLIIAVFMTPSPQSDISDRTKRPTLISTVKPRDRLDIYEFAIKLARTKKLCAILSSANKRCFFHFFISGNWCDNFVILVVVGAREFCMINILMKNGLTRRWF